VMLKTLHRALEQARKQEGGKDGGESLLRVHWVAVPEALRARRVNRRRRHAGAQHRRVGGSGGGGGSRDVLRVRVEIMGSIIRRTD
jgi:hypothetical protein